MPRTGDTRKFRNEELLLRVSETVDPARWNEARYEGFLEALCGHWEFQKLVLGTALRYLVGGRYENLASLAEENYHSNETLQDRFGTFENMERHLLFPDRLYGTLDLATGTGKSYVLYGLAAVLLAEGIADRVLVLCPSNTIEAGLIEKFRQLAADGEVRDALPSDAKVRTPRVIRADETITDGAICVENYHAVLGHVKSSIRDSLEGRGGTTLVLNDEVHHVASKPGQDQKQWKQFLGDPAFGFRRIVGVSGTCYVENDYFADVIARYSLREAIRDGFVKDIHYVADEAIGRDPNERFQVILANHRENRRKFKQIKPLTIFVTRDIARSEQLAEDWIDFLADHEKLDPEKAAGKVLVVTSAPKHEPNVAMLRTVDNKNSPVEWIMSVSMLTEGWDVKNVFQIVPHEERAFNSKLLIAQVLGRGLRVPTQYIGKAPAVTVFNHDAWSAKIKHLVEEVLEKEKRLTCRPVEKRPNFHFVLHNLDYTREPEAREYQQQGEYLLLNKGYVDLPTQMTALEREVEYVKASSGERYIRRTEVTQRMYSVDEVAEQILNRLKSIDEESAAFPDPKDRTSYAQKYGLEWCREVVRRSLRQANELKDQVSEENRQKILAALGPLQRAVAKSVRYRLLPKQLRVMRTQDRHADSVSVDALHRDDWALFYSPQSKVFFDAEEAKVFDEITGAESALPRRAVVMVANEYHFRTPLNVAIANHEPERRFMRKLVEPANAEKVDAWIKSTDRDFYPIEFSWKKGEHTKRASFNPDVFIKQGKNIFVVEIKDDSQVSEPSAENREKWKAAVAHFARVNAQQNQATYQVNFLAPRDFDAFFQVLRSGELLGFRSSLEFALQQNGSVGG